MAKKLLKEKEEWFSSAEGKTREELINSITEQLFGIHLCEKERKFLQLIKRGVRLHVTRKLKRSKEFKEFADLLSNMHKSGFIPSFQIVIVEK